MPFKVLCIKKKVRQKTFRIDVLDQKTNNNEILLETFGQYRTMRTFGTQL